MTAGAPLWAGRPEGRWFTRIEITTMLNGALLALPLHVVTGRSAGPTLGIVASTHGDEFLPTIAIRSFLAGLDTARLKGRIAVVSVANPLATAAFGRLSPEQHGRTDLNEVYPGNPRGNATQRIAAAIVENLIAHCDAFLDFHSGGSGGRLQARADYEASAQGEVKARSLALARAFGMPFVHENDLAGTAARCANARGIPAFNPEMGGSYLGPENTALYTRQPLDGLGNVLAELGGAQKTAPPAPFRAAGAPRGQALAQRLSRLPLRAAAGPGEARSRESPARRGGGPLHLRGRRRARRALRGLSLLLALLRRGRSGHAGVRARAGGALGMARLSRPRGLALGRREAFRS
jgi:predicted deacylase